MGFTIGELNGDESAELRAIRRSGGRWICCCHGSTGPSRESGLFLGGERDNEREEAREEVGDTESREEQEVEESESTDLRRQGIDRERCSGALPIGRWTWSGPGSRLYDYVCRYGSGIKLT